MSARVKELLEKCGRILDRIGGYAGTLQDIDAVLREWPAEEERERAARLCEERARELRELAKTENPDTADLLANCAGTADALATAIRGTETAREPERRCACGHKRNAHLPEADASADCGWPDCECTAFAPAPEKETPAPRKDCTCMWEHERGCHLFGTEKTPAPQPEDEELDHWVSWTEGPEYRDGTHWPRVNGEFGQVACGLAFAHGMAVERNDCVERMGNTLAEKLVDLHAEASERVTKAETVAAALGEEVARLTGLNLQTLEVKQALAQKVQRLTEERDRDRRSLLVLLGPDSERARLSAALSAPSTPAPCESCESFVVVLEQVQAWINAHHISMEGEALDQNADDILDAVAAALAAPSKPSKPAPTPDAYVAHCPGCGWTGPLTTAAEADAARREHVCAPPPSEPAPTVPPDWCVTCRRWKLTGLPHHCTPPPSEPEGEHTYSRVAVCMACSRRAGGSRVGCSKDALAPPSEPEQGLPPRGHPSEPEGRCATCGGDLDGNRERCPECVAQSIIADDRARGIEHPDELAAPPPPAKAETPDGCPVCGPSYIGRCPHQSRAPKAETQEDAPPCGGSRCYRATDGSWFHTTKSYGSCSVNRAVALDGASASSPSGGEK